METCLDPLLPIDYFFYSIARSNFYLTISEQQQIKLVWFYLHSIILCISTNNDHGSAGRPWNKRALLCAVCYDAASLSFFLRILIYIYLGILHLDFAIPSISQLLSIIIIIKNVHKYSYWNICATVWFT